MVKEQDFIDAAIAALKDEKEENIILLYVNENQRVDFLNISLSSTENYVSMCFQKALHFIEYHQPEFVYLAHNHPGQSESEPLSPSSGDWEANKRSRIFFGLQGVRLEKEIIVSNQGFMIFGDEPHTVHSFAQETHQVKALPGPGFDKDSIEGVLLNNVPPEYEAAITDEFIYISPRFSFSMLYQISEHNSKPMVFFTPHNYDQILHQRIEGLYSFFSLLEVYSINNHELISLTLPV